MDIKIIKGTAKYLDDCERILCTSEHGTTYFSKNLSARKAIIEGMQSETLYIALVNNVCAGFISFIPKGAFHSYTYVYLIAIKDSLRNTGIGGKLLQYVEAIIFAKSAKAFVTVPASNNIAKKFFESFGYKTCSEIEDLYLPDTKELIMCKSR